MKIITAIILSISLVSIVSVTIADQHKKEGTFTTKPIRPGITLLQGKGGNIVVSSGPDGLLLIDDDYAEMSDALTAQINKLGGIHTLKFILNTHWHGDHTGGNEHLGKHTHIVAHDNVRKRLSQRQEIRLFNMVSDPKPAHALPTVTYPQSMVIHFNNDTLTLQHYPSGHTDGDSVIFFEKANVVHMGDLMFYPMFPFVDIDSGGNAITYADNVGQVVKKINNNTIVIPGHGPITDKKGLIQYHTMLTKTIAEVKAMKSSGMSLKNIQSKGLSTQWNSWHNGFIKEPFWILFIYNSL